MNSRDLHARGLLDDYGAIVAALVDDGWPQDEAAALLARYTGDVKATRYRGWTAEQRAELDEILDDVGDVLPGVAITRPLAARLGRSHRSVTSALERRIVARRGPELSTPGRADGEHPTPG